MSTKMHKHLALAAALSLSALTVCEAKIAPRVDSWLEARLGAERLVLSYALSGGAVSSIVITSANFSSIQQSGPYAAAVPDLWPISQFVTGWTADVTFSGMTPTGNMLSYAGGQNGGIPAASSSIPVNRPYYDAAGTFHSASSSTGLPTVVNFQAPLRQPTPNLGSPSEINTSGGAKVAVTLNDFIYGGDYVGKATVGAGVYNGNALAPSVPVTNNSTRVYPTPIGNFVTEPGLRIGSGASYTVEFFAGYAYGRNAAPLAAVKFTASDAAGHSASHVVSTMAQSTRLWSTSCTATNGSNVLTGCGDTSKLQVGARLTVPGIPGQPEVLAWTSNTITLGQSISSCQPNANGSETIATAPGVGEGFGDGAFPGALISDADLSASPVAVVKPVATGVLSSVSAGTATLTISGAGSGQFMVNQWVSYTGMPGAAQAYISALGTGTGGNGTYTVHYNTSYPIVAGTYTITGSEIAALPTSNPVASITISTAATSRVSATPDACVIKHVFTGTTGTVTATLGNPVPVYAATFTASDFTSNSFNNGPIAIRAQALPAEGNTILDTQYGADGTGCDWWSVNVTGTGGFGVCDSGNAAYFGATGTAAASVPNAEVISPNVHNLLAFYDGNNSYAPAYVWIDPAGSCASVSCVSTSAADPGASSGRFASPFAALTYVKSFNNNATNRATVHNDLNGAVFCYLAPSSGTNSYGGFGGQINTSVTLNQPPIIMTSALVGGNCPATGTANSSIAGVTFIGGTVLNNAMVAPYTHINNLTVALSSSYAITGGQAAALTSALSTSVILDNDALVATSTNNIAYKVGAWWIYNSFVNQSGFEALALTPAATSGGLALAAGNTLVCGSFSTRKAAMVAFNALGNVGWGCSPAGMNNPSYTNYSTQPISSSIAFNKFMGMTVSATWGGGVGWSALQNLMISDNIFELLNNTGGALTTIWTAADGSSQGINNVLAHYNTVLGSRWNADYDEGSVQGQFGTPTTTTGALAAGYLYGQLNYECLASASTNPACNGATETSTDGPSYIGLTTGTTSAAKIYLPCDKNYNVSIYLGYGSSATVAPSSFTNIAVDGVALGGTGGVSSTTLAVASFTYGAAGSFALGTTLTGSGISGAPQITACPAAGCGTTGNYTMSSAQTIAGGTTLTGNALNLKMCQAVTLTAANGTSQTATPFSSTSFPAHGQFNYGWFERFNIIFQDDAASKGDSWGPGAGTNGQNPARIGVFERRFNVYTIGNVGVVNAALDGFHVFSNQASLGEVPCLLCVQQMIAPGNFQDTSIVVYDFDRSFGGTGVTAAPGQPALNIGQGHYHVTLPNNVSGRVPQYLASWPFDIWGTTRKNDGTGCAGAYEC